jgi:branched-chain amino acid transport system ATP-binding protein
VLETDQLVKRFGGVAAVDGVSLRVGTGELHGLIGPNGAGKSTLFHLVTGHLRATSGQVVLDGRDVTGLPSYRRARLGIGIAFQSVRLFRGMSVLENVMVGAHAWTRHGFWEALLRLPRHVREEAEVREAAERALEEVGLTGLAGSGVEALPLGRLRELQVARALCSRPRLLLLDEPASGLRAGERARLAALLARLRGSGMTMLLVEHDVAFVAGLASTITVLDRGQVIAEGPPERIRRNPAVIAAYLGQELPEAAGA